MRNIILIFALSLSFSGSIVSACDRLPWVQKDPSLQFGSDSQDPKEKNLEGTVEVSFSIDATGKVNIVDIAATSQELADYVVKKLNKIQLNKNDSSQIGKIIKYRFVFKKQA
ncbi:MAG: hypothetical protein SH856_07565 [Flavobacteriales bacterium]|mgnify:CR=1 FL=1|nr:hypothetical protein [Flavobacteriales bacterium]